MYILASDFFENDDKYKQFKARNSCWVWEFLDMYSLFFKKYDDLYIRNLEN